MRITKVHIDEYKIFKNFDIDFTHEGKSQNLIVLAGINGTGKTTLIHFIEQAINNTIFKSVGSYIEYSHNFPELSDEQNYGRLELNDIRYDPGRENAIMYEVGDRSNSNVESSIVAYIDDLIYSSGMLPFDAYDSLRRFISKIFEGFDLSFEFQQLTAFKKPLFKNKIVGDLNLEDLSTGERQILTNVLRLFIYGAHRSIVVIDEPEFSLHPSWQNLVAKVYQRYADEYNCQIILATHSPQIIGSVRPEQIRVLKNDDGVITAIEPMSSYGLPVDRVLMEVMGIQHLRTLDVDRELDELNNMISNNQYDDQSFIKRMKKMEETLGYTDRDLVLMRFEIAKRKKQK